jgi:acetyltransferase
MMRYPVELLEHWDTEVESLTIRPIRPEDAGKLDALFHRMPPEDVRHRFFAAIRELSPEQLAKFTRLDYEKDMAFVAVRDSTGEVVGVARLAREDDPALGEFAVEVQPDVKGHGVATHLMHRLFDWARQHGVKEVVGEILADNEPMLDLARFLGFTLHFSPDDPMIIEAHLPLA